MIRISLRHLHLGCGEPLCSNFLSGARETTPRHGAAPRLGAGHGTSVPRRARHSGRVKP